MNKEVFINQCVQSGYCSRKMAEMYCKNKESLTDNDFIEVFRIVERAKEVAVCIDKYHKVEGVKTTKIYEHRGC
jgi:hypothetical protein